jgi:7-carboxy-7-deazaguanine synthase
MKHEISEIFISLEGEGPFTAHPTAYIRFGRCNFKCPEFNNHNSERDSKGYAPLGFVPGDFQKLTDIPLITKGCDSQYAVNPTFAHMWEKLTTDELVDRLIDLLPHKSWTHPRTGLPVILSLTGGEPTLKWKFIPEILNHPKMAGCKHVLVETNCAVPFKREFTMNISQWLMADNTRTWTWSNSPKLVASGEVWEEAIRPEIAMKQLEVIGDGTRGRVNQYFKFVVGPRDRDFSEVKLAMEEYFAAGIPNNTPIWIMSEACTQEQQQAIAQAVAKMCLEEGFIFCYRLQNGLFGNGVGT